MAVATWTQRAVLELFPEFLRKRRRGFVARRQEIAREIGISDDALLMLGPAVQWGQDGVLTHTRLRWVSVYVTKDPWPPLLDEDVRAGLLDRDGDAWRLTARGRETFARVNGEARAYVASLPLPATQLSRLAPALEALVRRIPPGSERATAGRRLVPSPEEARHHVVRVEQTILELWLRRDDCHIGAWETAGYEGPALDVLSQVWEGKTTLDEVAAAIANKQERANVERNVETLIARGDLVREGDALRLTTQGRASRDAIERETDRRYFNGWPTGEDLARIGDDLSAINAALPT